MCVFVCMFVGVVTGPTQPEGRLFLFRKCMNFDRKEKVNGQKSDEGREGAEREREVRERVKRGAR